MRRATTPFTAPVPIPLRSRLILLQHKRLGRFVPMLCLIICANAVAMTLAVLGDLPWWQQFTPPALLVMACMAVFLYRNRIAAKGRPNAPRALRHLRQSVPIAAVLGLTGGLWGVNAFTETEAYYCMVAPVFIGIAALTSATCLLSVPRAAIAAMVAAVAPIVIKMACYDNLGIRAMAAMMVLITLMQAGVVLATFRETVAMLTMQHDLDRAASTDPLTALDNRLAFHRKLESRLAAGRKTLLVLADLDGFKSANDTHGHLAGDAILREVAARMQCLGARALSVARIGGDEFALLYNVENGTTTALGEIAAIRAALSFPIVWGTQIITIGASFGTAVAPAEARVSETLIHLADTRLYADKAARKAMAA